MKKRHVFVVFAVGVISMLAAACGAKKAGGPCKANESTCIDKKTAIACRGGTFSEVACAGPAGCSKYKDHANCDTSVANAGEPCLGEDDEYACSPDKKHALVCKGTKFEPHLECRGKAGCTMLGRTFSCDMSIAEKGDPCKTAGAMACSVDEKLMLVCRDGKFALHRYCRGKNGCASAGETPTCDETISLAGDPCGIPGQVVCAVDGKTELVCQSGIFTKSITCKTACTISNRPGHPIECL